MSAPFQSAVFDPGRVQAILFDIDGTLVDTDDMLVERLARYLRWPGFVNPAYDPRRTARRLVMAFESPTNWILHALDRSGLDQGFGLLLDQLHRLRGDRPRGEVHLVPGAGTALERLAPHFRLAVVTAREQRSSESILQGFDLRRYFECVITARTCRHSKPHPAPVICAAQQLDRSPDRCLMVGDTTVDILAGKRAGAQTVGVLSGFGDQTELLAVGADLILEGVGDLPALLLSGHAP